MARLMGEMVVVTKDIVAKESYAMLKVEMEEKKLRREEKKRTKRGRSCGKHLSLKKIEISKAEGKGG